MTDSSTNTKQAYKPDGHGRTDEQIRADIHEALRNQRGGQASGAEALSISVGDGIVTLRGQVESEAEQHRIADLVRAIPSVRELRDQLHIHPD